MTVGANTGDGGDGSGRDFLNMVRASPAIDALWRNWHRIDLPDCWLVAGCLAQTVWNHRFGLPLDHGISDIDLVYFDPDDLTEATEAARAERIRTEFADLGIWIDVKNEARVHLWYEARFGYPIAPYLSTIDAMDSFPTTATTIGVRSGPSGTSLHATFGLEDLFQGIVRPNKRQITQTIYETKVARWLRHWPDLDIITWDAGCRSSPSTIRAKLSGIGNAMGCTVLAAAVGEISLNAR